ncbi:hypothetical protein ACWFRB_25760 [Rhodococcus sp. NPDC055112]
MSDADRWVLSQTLADEHSEDVSREEVADLARYLAGDITADEYELRAAWRQVGAETVQLDHSAFGPLRLDTVA